MSSARFALVVFVLSLSGGGVFEVGRWLAEQTVVDAAARRRTRRPRPRPPRRPPRPRPRPLLPAEAAAPPAAGGALIAGKIEDVEGDCKGEAQGPLFLTARRLSDNPSVRGSLVAVKKLPATTFPLEFTISAADMPFQGGAFDRELTLTARIDQDGDPLSRQKGDPHQHPPQVRVGSLDVRAVARPGAEGSPVPRPSPAWRSRPRPDGRPQDSAGHPEASALVAGRHRLCRGVGDRGSSPRL